MGLAFVVSVAGCIQYALFCTSDFAPISCAQVASNDCVPTKSLTVRHLSTLVIPITQLSAFGAANASLLPNKEAANSAP
jgi:hypothetical protein